ncbi:MAG TPA: cellulose biosynthesis cyclic di-GMP-binding regulatory protein BcsB [Dehalococcoidia bacterium]|nr:cellulose biosynthesis cyclic di-GMP-binding regulatory protein BcsB [Dehalococcoidia bacterium]
MAVFNLRVRRSVRLLAAALPALLIGPLVAHHSAPRALADGGAGPHSFRALGYGDRTARTLYGSLDYFFPVARSQSVQAGTTLDLDISHSPLLVPDRSTATVVVNGQSVTSAFLTPDNQNHGQLAVQVPAQPDATGGLFVQVAFSLRLTHDTCEETQNPALWATVHGDSQLTLATAAAKAPGLQDLDALFAPSPADTAPLSLSLPANPAPQEIEAAGDLAFQSGRWAQLAGQDANVTLNASPPAGQPAIVVGSGPALQPAGEWGTVAWNGSAFTANGAAVQPDRGLLALRNGPQLLVSGGTPAAARDAAQMLANREHRPQLAGDHAVLTSGTQLTAAAPPAWGASAASFAQLGLDRRQVSGPGEHDVELSFDRPSGWTLGDGSVLQLSVAASTALHADTSWIAASVNGYDLGTQKLQAGDESAHSYRFDLPAELLNTDLNGAPQRRLDLQVRVYLDLSQTGCTQSAPDSAWAALEPTSAWLLPHTRYTGRDLGRFPAGLLSGDGTPLTVVLPAKPTQAELNAGIQVLAALGRWTAEDVTQLPRLVPADQLPLDQPVRGNAVLVGGPDRNLISGVAERAAPGLFAAPTPAASASADGNAGGWLRLAPSPWDKRATVLALSGADDAGVQAAATALTKRAELSTLRGGAAVISAGLPAQTSPSSESAEVAPQALAPRLVGPAAQPKASTATKTRRLQTWQVVGAVLLGAFVTIIGAVLFLKLRPGRTS